MLGRSASLNHSWACHSRFPCDSDWVLKQNDYNEVQQNIGIAMIGFIEKYIGIYQLKVVNDDIYATEKSPYFLEQSSILMLSSQRNFAW